MERISIQKAELELQEDNLTTCKSCGSPSDEEYSPYCRNCGTYWEDVRNGLFDD